MPRWLTLPAASAILLAFAACSAPLGALELNYHPPEPSISPPQNCAGAGAGPQSRKTADCLAEAR